jgi:hypothetical protein
VEDAKQDESLWDDSEQSGESASSSENESATEGSFSLVQTVVGPYSVVCLVHIYYHLKYNLLSSHPSSSLLFCRTRPSSGVVYFAKITAQYVKVIHSV